MTQPDRPSSSSMDTPVSDPRLNPASMSRDLSGADLGDFHVERQLGKGGMGVVYLARQVSLNREVALKVLRPDLLTNQTLVTRFEAESWAAAKLNHPNIVHIYTVGVSEGLRFIAMEYVQGTNLREFLARKGPPELLQALSIMRQAGAAVGAAGEVGLVHRDIKPENLLLTKKGQVKVADFGLCRDLDSDRHHITQTGITLGTPLYMSPEQARGSAMDHRSDLYSLGVTFYHMLSGQPPFRADTALALAMKHVSEVPTDLSVHRPDIPAELVRLVMKLIAKDPADRYQSAGEMLRGLSKIREALQLSAIAGAAGLASLPGAELAPIVPEPAAKPAPRAREKPTPPPPPSSFGQAEAGWFAWPSARTICAAGAVGLLAGALLGWSARPVDLLTPTPAGRKAPPALWVAPDWRSIVKQKPTPEEQYRHALLHSTPGDREAAWVAVSGYFPDDQQWTSRSYAQLGRELFRVGDRVRLDALATVLAASHQGRNRDLAHVMGAGVGALEGDVEKVLQEFGGSNFSFIENNLFDASVADFGVEIVARVRDDPRRKLPTMVGEKLRAIQGKLIQKMIAIKQNAPKG